MATVAELQRRRKEALREARRRQRALDTQIERIERKIFSLLDRKTLITREDALNLVPMWNEFTKLAQQTERGLTDFISVCSV